MSKKNNIKSEKDATDNKSKDNKDDDEYSRNFNNFLYSGSISFLIIIITFLITVNVLSVGYFQHKSNNITLINDVEKILTNTVSAFTSSEIKEHIFTPTYKNILNWHNKSNKFSSFLYELTNCIFPPLLIIIYFVVFCILQIYTFFKGIKVTLINAIKVDISTIMLIYTLTILFFISVPFIYLLFSKVINLSVVASILLTVVYYIIFSTLPFTGLSSLYIFIMIFFNSYNKVNKLFFNISPLIFLFLLYTLITFCSISLANNPPKGVKITSTVIISIISFLLLLIIIANLIKTFKPDLLTNKFLSFFNKLVSVPEYDV